MEDRRTLLTLHALSFVFVTFQLIGCAAKTTSVGISPEKVARISAEISHTDQPRKRILDKYGVTSKEYSKAALEVDSDPDLGTRFNEAYQKAAEKLKKSNDSD